MKFATWLENNEYNFLDNLHGVIYKVANMFGVLDKWQSRIDQLMESLKNDPKFQPIVEYLKKDLPVLSKRVDYLEELRRIDTNSTLSYSDKLEDIPNYISSISYNLPTQLSAMFREIEKVAIAEKQERIDRMYKVFHDIADILDMRPIPDIKAKFEEFKTMSHSSDFWNHVTEYSVMKMEEIINDIEKILTNQSFAASIGHYIFRIEKYYLPSSLILGHLTINSFLKEIINAAKS